MSHLNSELGRRERVAGRNRGGAGDKGHDKMTVPLVQWFDERVTRSTGLPCQAAGSPSLSPDHFPPQQGLLKKGPKSLSLSHLESFSSRRCGLVGQLVHICIEVLNRLLIVWGT